MPIRRSIATPPGEPTNHVDMTPEQEAAYIAGLSTDEDRLNESWRVLRQERDALLSETDWVGARGVNLSSAELEKYDIYRQSLRDLPESDSDPNNIVMPTL